MIRAVLVAGLGGLALAGCTGGARPAAALVPGALRGHWVAVDAADGGGFIEISADQVILHLAGLPRLAAPVIAAVGGGSSGRLTLEDGWRLYLDRSVQPVAADQPALGLAEALRVTCYRLDAAGGEERVGAAAALPGQAAALLALARAARPTLAAAAAPMPATPAPAPSPEHPLVRGARAGGDPDLLAAAEAAARTERERGPEAAAALADDALLRHRRRLCDLLERAAGDAGALAAADRAIAGADAYAAAMEDWRRR